MKVFLDECVGSWRLSRAIAGYEVRTARQMGWLAIENGELLALASQAFDAFVTVDRDLAFQQNLATWPIAIVVLRAKTRRLAYAYAPRPRPDRCHRDREAGHRAICR